MLNKIYFTAIEFDNNDDYQNAYFKYFIKEEVFSLEDYIDFIKESDRVRYRDQNADRLSSLWDFKDYDIYVNKAIDILLDENASGKDKWSNRNILESLFISADEKIGAKQNLWIEAFINSFTEDFYKMESIFNIISNFSENRKIAHIKTVINNSQEVELFKKLGFEPKSRSRSGSELPLIDKRIDFFESVMSLLYGSAFIDHKVYIKGRIEGLKKYRRTIRIEEFLRDY